MKGKIRVTKICRRTRPQEGFEPKTP